MQQVHKTVKAKSRKFCSVSQCTSYCTDGISLHKFPLRDTKLCKVWTNILKIGKPVTQNMYVCSEHFVGTDFFNSKEPSGIKRKPPKLLKKTAIPSVNIPKSSFVTVRSERRKLKKHDDIHKEESEMQCENLENRRDNELTEPMEQNSEYQIVQNDNELIEPSVEQIVENNGDMELDQLENQIQPVMLNNVLVETSVQTTEYIFQLPQILNTDEKLRNFTGVDYTILKAYTKCVENVAAAEDLNLSNIKCSIMLVLCKLKTNLSFACLALLFGISNSMCTRIFYSTVNLLAVSIKPVIYWPTREEISKNLPKCFNKFKNTRVVLDCTEVKVQKLKCLNCRILSYSHYKRSHTIKFLIGVTPSGLISYISQGYGGRATDKAIFNRENLIEKFEPKDGIMVDKGVLIDTECEENFIKLIRPPFLRKKKQLTKEDARLTADIARARVHVERAIEKIKNFSIVNDQIDWYLIPYIDDIITIVAATVNMKAPILADDKF